MDKSWISKPRNTLEYAKGLESFLDFAFLNSSVNGRIKCPCSHCGFRKMETREVVYEHLLRRQFPSGYTLWLCHGEEPSVLAQVVNESERDVSHSQNDMVSENSIQDMIHEAFRNGHQRRCEEPSVLTQFVNEIEGDLPEGSHRQSDFDDLIWDSNEQLYEGCTKYSKLAFLIKLYHIKVLCRMTDKAMTMILELLQDAFEHAKIPKSFYEAKKVINKLGLNYEKIDACPNDCMLYWKEDETRESCKVCGKSRYKENGSNSQSGGNRKKKKSAKILRYFPLKPRLQRLFMSSKTAEDMRWHAVGNNSDSSMRHPRDSEAWKTFDRLHTDFSNDPRNVRLGLASDGFNPFGTMSTNYSIWPVVLMPYNLPPWMCMKPTSFILSMIIPGKKQPGNDIDIYLQPLIEELKELWNNGVATYDSSSSQVFTMRAALMWTISDFPGLGTLSGWNVYNGTACPCCNKDFKRHRLTHGGKFCFMGHRRFLERGHKFRLRRAQFDGDVELRDPPKLLSGLEILEQVKNIDVTLGKKPKSNTVGKRTRGKNVEESDSRQWRKKSVFFELPYWKFNLIRHNLDVMHIEKNVCDNVLYTLLNDASRTKDNLNARKDLLSLGIRRDLWPDEKGKYKPALYTLSNASKTQFLTILKNVTVPDGYSSNIASSIDLDQRKITGLKSHDSHILMEQLLPLAMRKVLPNQISAVLIDVCSFFKHLCGKVLVTSELEKLQERIVVTLCHLETIFPPSFFTVMVHLLVHLVEEVKCGGPVHYRWMYPIERYLGHLKSYVRNRAQPEGSIAEGYIAEECLTFSSRYLHGIETRFNRLRRVDDDPGGVESSQVETLFPRIGKPVGSGQYFNLTPKEKHQAHRHILFNSEVVAPFLKEFQDITKQRLRNHTRKPAKIQKVVHREFVSWFEARILNDTRVVHPDDIIYLARGPHMQARRFTAYNVNGYKFRTLAREEGMKTQNSGVFGAFGTNSYASTSDKNPKFASVLYYGKLEDIIELNYYGRFTITMFKCKWANTTTSMGKKVDALGFLSVNFSHLIHTGENDDDEPYIRASDAQMVYYVDDKDLPKKNAPNVIVEEWCVPVHLKPRDLFDMGEDGEDTVLENMPFPSQDLDVLLSNNDEEIPLARNDNDGEADVVANIENINENIDVEMMA